MSLVVREAPIFATVQDAGRSGYARYGIPLSGWMDDHSARLANWLTGNDPDTPLIEIGIRGGTFECMEYGVIAVTGARCKVQLNEQEIEAYRSCYVRPGDLLSIGRISRGRYAYLAVKGGRPGKQIMGSHSTCLQGAFGGSEGGLLKEGYRIYHEKVLRDEFSIRTTPADYLPHFSRKQHIRVIAGPEFGDLSKKEQDELLSSRFIVRNDSDRMGIRLRAEETKAIESEEIPSSPVLPGIVQYSGDANFIVLLKDAQTIGGYPRLLKVIDAELWRISQCATGTEILFELLSNKEAIQRHQFMTDLYDRLEKRD